MMSEFTISREASIIFPTKVTSKSNFKKCNLDAQYLKTYFTVDSCALIPQLNQNESDRQKNGAYKIYTFEVEPKTKAIKQHEYRCIDATRSAYETKAINWLTVEKKLLLPTKKDTKNCDQRMIFVKSPIYLVKCYFTFGCITVDPDQVHIYQTGNNPIYFYKYKGLAKKIRPKNRSFQASTQKRFELFMLQPQKMYFIPAGETYLLLTCQKTVFALNILTQKVFEELKDKFHFEPVVETTFSSLAKKKPLSRALRSNPYDKEPPTPAFDQLLEEKESENLIPNAEDFFPQKKKMKLADNSTSRVDSDGFLIPSALTHLPSSEPNPNDSAQSEINVVESTMNPLEFAPPQPEVETTTRGIISTRNVLAI